mgnify:CR=1 FL=1
MGRFFDTAKAVSCRHQPEPSNIIATTATTATKLVSLSQMSRMSQGHAVEFDQGLAASFEERAGFLEFDAGVERKAAEGLAAAEHGYRSVHALYDDLVNSWRRRLAAMWIEEGLSGFWPLVIADALKVFENGWANHAASLGWSETDLFGVHPHASEERLDCKGLIPGLAGRRILAITRDDARIDSGNGAFLTFYRAGHDTYGEAVPIWEVL